MKRSAVRVPVLAIVACLAGGGRFVLAQDAKPTLAIADVAVSRGLTLPRPQLGGAVVDLLVSELVAGDRFRVYDGQWSFRCCMASRSWRATSRRSCRRPATRCSTKR